MSKTNITINIGGYNMDPVTLGIAVISMLVKTIGKDTFWNLIDQLKSKEISLETVQSIIPNDEYSKKKEDD